MEDNRILETKVGQEELMRQVQRSGIVKSTRNSRRVQKKLAAKMTKLQAKKP